MGNSKRYDTTLKFRDIASEIQFCTIRTKAKIHKSTKLQTRTASGPSEGRTVEYSCSNLGLQMLRCAHALTTMAYAFRGKLM